MRRFAVVLTLASVAFLVPAPALAAPSPVPAERMCARHGGELEYIPESGTYHCRAESFTDTQLTEAKRLCELAYKGDFVPMGSHVYHCFDR
jgi:hypothetical protein